MADTQYDIDEQSRKILLEKAQRRAVLREQFLKLKSDPFRHASNEGGAVFDPAYYRYQALRVSGTDFFKPTFKNVKLGLLYIVIPMGVFGYILKRSREETEAKYRRGEVAYRDRKFKFI